MPTSINGNSGGGATAPAGTGVVTVSGGAFVDPVASAATTRATLDAQQDVFTTRGDLVRAGVAGVAERLPLGANGYVLTSDGTDAAWAAAGGGGGTWLSLYGGTALWMGGDSAFGFAQADRVSASAAAAVPAFGPGQSMVVVLYPGATPTGIEVIASHVAVSSVRGFYLAVGSNAGARRRLGLFLSGLNGSAELSLTGSDFTVGTPYVIAICVKADKSIRYSVNGGTVATVSALSGSYNATSSADTLRLASPTEFSPSFYPLTSALIGAARWYSTELSDADLVAACAGVSTASIPTVATGTVSASFSAAAFAGGVRVVAASPTPTWIAAGNPAIRGV
tara:strand:- start:901 stop:1911 length:1011 start_codon:yes stop_codon:yes gene_type:complete